MIDIAHDIECEHFAEAAALAATVQQQWQEIDRLRDGIAARAAWWDRNGPAVPAFRLVDDFRALLDGEADDE